MYKIENETRYFIKNTGMKYVGCRLYVNGYGDCVGPPWICNS